MKKIIIFGVCFSTILGASPDCNYRRIPNCHKEMFRLAERFNVSLLYAIQAVATEMDREALDVGRGTRTFKQLRGNEEFCAVARNQKNKTVYAQSKATLLEKTAKNRQLKAQQAKERYGRSRNLKNMSDDLDACNGEPDFVLQHRLK